jgi:RHS repeat-associated protein
VQEDASGAQEFFYGPLGETVKNVRTIVIPKFGTQTYVTQWAYDTWNRLTSMIYPDSEVITYNYNLGGLLNSMSGNRQGQDFTYVQQLGYDQFESRVFLSYGNGTQTTYAYEPDRRRLQNLTATTGKGRRIMDNVYAYDKVDNILSLTNNAPVPSSNLMGGSSQYGYTYDDLYRLTTASGNYKGPQEQDRYSMTMEYNTVGSITRKTQTNDKTNGPGGNKWIPQKKTTYDLSYSYGPQQPHAATHIGSQTYTYDADGNQTGRTDDLTGQRQNLDWDEENRLRSVSVNGQLNSYVYDAAGERVLKGQGSGQSVFVNGELKAGSGGVGNFTVYVNPYLVVQSGQYSKHYFIESQRITTRLELGWQQQVSAPAAGDAIAFPKKEQQLLQGIARDQQAVQGTGQQQVTAVTGPDARGVANSNGQASGNGNGTTGGSPDPTNNGNHYAYGHYKGYTDTSNQSFLYFYHPDHLGSTSYVTDDAGEVYEHMEYFAFGETFVQEHSNTDRIPYLFNGKELDEETGLYYYGARYYDLRTSIWQSVDPLAEKYPQWSPYNYTEENPIRNIDPDGRGTTSDFKGINGVVKHIEDGSSAQYQEVGNDVHRHYQFTGFDNSQTSATVHNTVNLTTAIQEQQNLNLSNDALKPDGNTYCNYSTENVLSTVESATDNSKGIAKEGKANSVVIKWVFSVAFKEVDKSTALATAANGDLALLGFVNGACNADGTEKHGHVATFSVGENRSKGQVANVGSENGFKGVSAEDGRNHIFSEARAPYVQYFILQPYITPKSNPDWPKFYWPQ